MLIFYEFFPYLIIFPLIMVIILGFKLNKHSDYLFYVLKLVFKMQKTNFLKGIKKLFSNQNNQNTPLQKPNEALSLSLSSEKYSQVNFFDKNIDFNIYIKATKIHKNEFGNEQANGVIRQQTLQPYPTINRNQLLVNSFVKKIKKQAMTKENNPRSYKIRSLIYEHQLLLLLRVFLNIYQNFKLLQMKKTTFLNLQEQKKSQLEKEKQQEEKRKIMAKNTNVRALTNLKINMDKRLQQRSMALYYLTNAKVQSALIVGKQLMFSSQKVWRQFNDQFCAEFQQQYFFRTSKARQHLEYLLDSVLLCRIFIAAKKRQDAVDILQKLQLPDAPIVKEQNIETNIDKILFNEAHQIYSKTCATLLSLIQITKQLKIHQYTQKMFVKYLSFVQNYYGKIEYGTALFKHGNYLYQIQKYEQAQKQYSKCIAIRKGNVYNGGLIDALVNSSICLRELCEYEEAIQRMKNAIQINKDIMNGEGNLDQYYLFLAKLYFQSGDFQNAYFHFLYTYKLRQNIQKGDPKKVQIQLNFMFFYKTLRDINKNPQECLNLTDKKQIQQKKKLAQQMADMMQKQILQRQDFAKYKQFKSSKMAHLVLIVPKEFFDMLNSEQILQLNSLIDKLTQLTFMRGKLELFKCSFYKQKKTRDILIQANASLKQEIKTKV